VGTPTYDEHLEWSKKRAIAYADRGELTEAFSSMASDLEKHPETAKHPAIELGLMLLLTGNLSTPHKMREFIEEFR
jgi:hypothetical protein